MRQLYRYISKCHIGNGKFENERREILEEYEEADQKQFWLGNCACQTVKTILARAYRHAVQWQVLSDSVFHEMKVLFQDERKLLNKWRCRRPNMEINKYNSITQMFEEIAKYRYQSSYCIIGALTFSWLTKDAIAVRSRNAEVSIEYNGTDIVPEGALRYTVRHGPVTYDGNTVEIGAYILSRLKVHHSFCIHSCHVSGIIGAYHFQYHLCTNTFRYCKYEVYLLDSCARARMQELWCLKKHLYRTWAQIARNIPKDQQSNEDEQTIYNFL